MKRFDTINVIPLIDVMLVLLAIVLTTATFIAKDSLQIELPETNNTQTYQPPSDLPVIKIAINQDNQYFADEKPATLKQLASLLQTLPKDQALTLQVDKNADFGSFVQVIDLLKGLSLDNLTILTESKS